MTFLFFFKITQEFLPSDLQTNLNAVSEGEYLVRSTKQNKMKPIAARTKVFQSSFFPYFIEEISKSNDKVRNIDSINKFKVTILNNPLILSGLK